MKSYPFYKLSLLVAILCHCHLSFAADQEQLTVNATTTDVEGRSQKDVKEANKMADIFILQKQLVYKLLKNIGITSDKLSSEVKAAIDKPQTTSLEAFYAFSNCLDSMDKGLYVQAREQCNNAIQFDPNFVFAQRLRASIPDQNQSMSEIVADHMRNPNTEWSKPEEFASDVFISTVPNSLMSDETSVLITDLKNSGSSCQTQTDLGCQVIENDKSSPACDDNGHCGFYSTFLAQRNAGNGITVSTSPFMNRVAVNIPPNNPNGVISINQIGQEGKGSLSVQIDPNSQNSRVTGFNDAQFNQRNATVVDGQLDRIVMNQLPSKTNITGLELGAYLSGFDFNNHLSNAGGNQGSGLFHGLLYFAEGQATPTDTVKNLGKVHYEGVANGDFSVNGNLVPCQGSCGQFSSTLNYGAAKLEDFKLEANARQVDGNLTAAAQITANNVGIRPTGEFQFDQTNGGFKVGETLQTLAPADGNVAGRPFGNSAELVGGVFAIHNGNIQGAGSFGGDQIQK